MKEKDEVVEHLFVEELMYCPSQIYYYFTDMKNGDKYCLYLRWRYHDPWASYLVKCDDSYEFGNGKDWITIETSRSYKESEHELLEEDALESVKKLFPDTYFPGVVKKHTTDIQEYFDGLV